MPTNNHLTVVISQGQSRNPEKRDLEQGIVDSVSRLPGITVLKVPHLYDLPSNSETYTKLRELDGNLVVLAWLYDRATHWTLDRHGVGGQVGEVELRSADEEEEEDDAAGEVEEVERVINSQPRMDRQVYCIDFRVSNKVEDYTQEIARILTLVTPPNQPEREVLTLERLMRLVQPTNDTYVGAPNLDASVGSAESKLAHVAVIDEHPGRRWYPVIDFSRCTNCMECIDFCLFGVYGVDKKETIVVEQPDNCRKGCPACSRVCPQNAIIFPQHKTPAIAGAAIDTGGFKIDLSKLFGAPDEGEDAATIAARERDEQLILAGRETVGLTQGVSERLAKQTSHQADQPKDALDALIDQLDALDL